jgi:hypothetical protein
VIQQLLGSLNQIVYIIFGGLAVAVAGKLAYDQYKLGKDEDVIQNMKVNEELSDAKETIDSQSIDSLMHKLDDEFNSSGDK